MKVISVLFCSLMVVLFLTTQTWAGWDSCKGCHTDSGKPALSKSAMLKKFKTSEDLVKAAMASTHPMMQSMKNETVLKAAAKEIGLKEAKATTKDEKKKDDKKSVKGDDQQKKSTKPEEKPKEADKPKTEKKEPVKDSPTKTEDTKKPEETKKKKKPIEGC